MQAQNRFACMAALRLQAGPPSPPHAGAMGGDSLHGSPLRASGLTPHPAHSGHVRFKLPIQEMHPYGEALQGTLQPCRDNQSVSYEQSSACFTLSCGPLLGSAAAWAVENPGLIAECRTVRGRQLCGSRALLALVKCQQAMLLSPYS